MNLEIAIAAWRRSAVVNVISVAALMGNETGRGLVGAALIRKFGVTNHPYSSRSVLCQYTPLPWPGEARKRSIFDEIGYGPDLATNGIKR